jgi:hypothetical protein
LVYLKKKKGIKKMSNIDMVHILEAICKTNEELINDGVAEYDDNCRIADEALKMVGDIKITQY